MGTLARFRWEERNAVPNYVVVSLPTGPGFRLTCKSFQPRRIDPVTWSDARAEARCWYRDLADYRYKWVENDYGVIVGWPDYTLYIELWCEHVARLAQASRNPYRAPFHGDHARAELAHMIPLTPIRPEARESWEPIEVWLPRRIARLRAALDQASDERTMERIAAAIERETARLGTAPVPETFVIDGEPDVGIPTTRDGFPV